MIDRSSPKWLTVGLTATLVEISPGPTLQTLDATA